MKSANTGNVFIPSFGTQAVVLEHVLQVTSQNLQLLGMAFCITGLE
jgi:hypothetical protein